MENFYPYYLAPTGPFHLETLPVFGTEERIEFFYKYKRDSEKLYIGHIETHNLLLKKSNSLLSSIKQYFLFRQFENENIVKNFNRRLFPKVCWLTSAYFKSGFKYPVTVHYNPRIRANVMHPGGIRNHVIKLFHTAPKVNCLYFNTGGVRFEFIDSLRTFSKGDLLEYIDTLEIELVADHGSIIPYINLDTTTNTSNIETWQQFIRSRVSSTEFTIFSNKTIDFLQPWCVSEHDANIKITIGDVSGNEWEDIQCKAAILAILGKSYNSDNLTINQKILTTTPE